MLGRHFGQIQTVGVFSKTEPGVILSVSKIAAMPAEIPTAKEEETMPRPFSAAMVTVQTPTRRTRTFLLMYI